MGKLIVTEFVTLDGVAQAPGEPDEDGDGGFAHGGWQAPLMDESVTYPNGTLHLGYETAGVPTYGNVGI